MSDCCCWCSSCGGTYTELVYTFVVEIIDLHVLNFASSHSFVDNYQDIVAFAVQVLSRSCYRFLLLF